MKILIFNLLFTLSALTLSAQTLALEDIVSGKFSPVIPNEMTSTKDGEHYTQLSSDGSSIGKYDYRTGKLVETLFDTATARECNFDKINGYILSPIENKILLFTDSAPIYRYSFQANYWVYDIKRNLIEPLSEKNDKVRCAAFSPNGRMIAFVYDNNLYLKKLDYGTEIAVTKDGKGGQIINGAPDWLYEEEFMMEKAFDWSADSEQLAFLRFDESDVQSYTLSFYPDNADYPMAYSYKYPRAGTKNAKVSLHVYSVETKDIKKMNLPEGYEYIPRIHFTPDASQLAVFTLNRSQNNMTMFYAHPKTTVCKQIYKEENDTFVDCMNLKYFTFASENFVAVNEKDGYRHAYLYTSNGVLIKQLTSGNWDITDLYGFDEKNKTLYYQSAEESPLKRAVYSVNDKGKKNKLSRESGTNDAKFNHSFTYYVNAYSSANTVPVISINTNDGKQLREIETNAILQQHLNALAKKDFFTIPSSFGKLNAWMLKPQNFDASQKYPVLMVQYSGPDSQMVLDEFNVDWFYFLTTKGYIIVCVDGAGSGAKGEAFRKMSYLNSGIQESNSQIDAAKYVASLPYIDKNRIGIWGWSFGGFNALMSMSRGSGVFKTGIAIAPTTDWRLYNTAYTERFMRTPNENFDGYRQTSLLNLTNQLQGNILLIHGNLDDNVHIQHTYNYIDALIESEKLYDLQLYPTSNHGLTGEKTRLHLYKKICGYLAEKL